jgi:hypothetical protein
MLMFERTHYFADEGGPEILYDARWCARLVLELADELEAERSARSAIQSARERA